MIGVYDYIIIFIYILLIVFIGFYYKKKANSSVSDFFLSGRNLPWWIAGTSMAATSFSCDTPLYVTKLVRKFGIYYNWQWWSFVFGGLLSVFFFAKLWRRAKVLTDVELTELRYDGKAASFLRAFRSLYFSLIINTIGMGWVILSIAKISQAVFPVNKLLIITIFSILAFFYSFTAGFWGVVITDFIQFFIALIGSIVLSVYAVNSVGGIGVIKMKLAEMGLSSHLNFFVNLQNIQVDKMFFSTAAGAFLMFIVVQWWANINSDGGGKVIQRMSACKNEKHALLATFWFNFVQFGLRTWPWIIVALATLIIYPKLSDPEMAYPLLVVKLLPSGWKGVLLISFLAAFMSTVDTQLNWGASYLVNDFYKRFINSRGDEKHYIIVSKIATFFLLVVAGIAAFFTKSVTEAFKFIISFGSGVGSVYILRWFWWRVNAWTEISAMITSALVSSYFYIFTKGTPYPYILFMTVLISTIVLLIVTFVTKPVEINHLREFYDRVRPMGFWGIFRDKGIKEVRREFWQNIILWIFSIAFIIGITIGSGKLILQEYRQFVIWAVIAIIGLFILIWKKNWYLSDK